MSASQAAGTLGSDAAVARLDWAWFCLRAQHRHEHIATNCLRLMEDVEVFCPRLRYVQPRRYGKVWITEPLFPGYLFARFNWKESLCRVHYAPGVHGVVHFGNGWPTVPDQVIALSPRPLRLSFCQPVPEQPLFDPASVRSSIG